MAPTAFRSPISRVRSVTETSIIFMIPMPPTKSEIAAMPPSAAVITPRNWLMVDSSCVCSMTVNSSSLSRRRSTRDDTSSPKQIGALVVNVSYF